MQRILQVDSKITLKKKIQVKSQLLKSHQKKYSRPQSEHMKVNMEYTKGMWGLYIVVFLLTFNNDTNVD